MTHDAGIERSAAGAAPDLRAIAAQAAGGPPRGLSDIPGLGPIRIRALEKAGFGSLTALRDAGIEALMAVPGLSEVKARQIQEFLEPYQPDDLQAPPAELPAERGKEAGTHYDAGAAQVVQRATRAMGEVITVLLMPEASQFRSRFLRILGQFAQVAESIATDAAHLSPEQQERAVRRLRRAARSLSELTGATAADRKAQGRLADALEELTAKLTECRLS
ncbi:MAG TPA: helix-hairpin-helix domain-containing protein [Chthonomonadaceae bacterium]|nr:helix-hairpin-helix domain-containing protein [Chthonomonadaceae bacterium]